MSKTAKRKIRRRLAIQKAEEEGRPVIPNNTQTRRRIWTLLEMALGEDSEEFNIIRNNSAYFMNELYPLTLRIDKLLGEIRGIVYSSYVKREKRKMRRRLMRRRKWQTCKDVNETREQTPSIKLRLRRTSENSWESTSDTLELSPNVEDMNFD